MVPDIINLKSKKKITPYSFQNDLDRIAKEYTKSIHNIRSLIEVKRLERIKAKDSENIKQVEEELKSSIKQ